MTFTNPFDITSHLAKHHTHFATHPIDPTHTSFAFDQIMRATDAIKRESALISVDFSATMFWFDHKNRYQTSDTIVTIAFEDGVWDVTERIADEEPG